ncbi:hypothetical protein LBMAG42_03520 [Deltaproteobacteria bacterium]|nr:hypothetical protein LBMAG42_03520 [Deltaproteobacteria bacterium]
MWARAFATHLLDEVARPLFASPDADAFLCRLPDCLARGAILRFRWLNALCEKPVEESSELVNEWMRPPPPAVLGDFQRRAARLLGGERSFQLRRALELMFTDAVEGFQGVVSKWRAPNPGSRWIVEMARITEASASHDVLAIAWMAVLLGDVPAPSHDVANAAATALLELTSVRLAALRAVIGDEIAVPGVVIDDRALPSHWREAHRTLIFPMLMLVGLAFDDPQVRSVTLLAHQDPDDRDLSIVEIRLHAEGDHEDARLRLEDRATRAGVLGVMADEHGGMLAITTAPPRS